jgi:hypothetical protein
MFNTIRTDRAHRTSRWGFILRPSPAAPLLLLASLLTFHVRAEDQFTLAVIPDSQQEVLRADDHRLQNRMEWLVTQRESLNLKMVLHVGDLLNWDTPDHIQ